jgi:A nuclease of the HNH/ENDO VII superfamily with conserved WHH
MGNKLRTLKKVLRKAGAAKGIFKKVGLKLRLARSLPNRGVRPPHAAPSAFVKRLPSGRFPPNARKWAGKIYKGDQWTPALAKKYPNGVRFTRNGFPDFSPYAVKTITFKKGFKDRAADIAAANRRFQAPDGYTWHHHQDGRTMQLIPTDLHDAIRHGGGIATTGAGG